MNTDCQRCGNTDVCLTPHSVVCDECGTHLAHVPDDLQPYWLMLLHGEKEQELYYVD